MPFQAKPRNVCDSGCMSTWWYPLFKSNKIIKEFIWKYVNAVRQSSYLTLFLDTYLLTCLKSNMRRNFPQGWTETDNGFTTCGISSVRTIRPDWTNSKIACSTNWSCCRADWLFLCTILDGAVMNGILYPYCIMERIILPKVYVPFKVSFHCFN